MIGTAWAADAAGEHGGGIFSDPAFWVGVAFLLFFALAGKAMWKRVSDMLDKRTAAIVKALEDAQRLRDEALKAKQDAERTLTQAAAEGGAILQHAREEAERMQAKAAVDVALSATRALLREQVGAGRSEAMITEAIGELPRRLH
jgi:F-type H+-transporting ATPase subunit b